MLKTEGFVYHQQHKIGYEWCMKTDLIISSPSAFHSPNILTVKSSADCRNELDREIFHIFIPTDTRAYAHNAIG